MRALSSLICPLLPSQPKPVGTTASYQNQRCDRFPVPASGCDLSVKPFHFCIPILTAFSHHFVAISPSCCNFGAQTSRSISSLLVNRQPMPRRHDQPGSPMHPCHCHAYGTREQFFVDTGRKFTHGILIWSFRRCEALRSSCADLYRKAAFQLCRGQRHCRPLFGSIDDRLFAIEFIATTWWRTTGSIMLTRPCEWHSSLNLSPYPDVAAHLHHYATAPAV